MATNESKVLEILRGIYTKLEHLDGSAVDGRYLNERYLHHYFSHEVLTKTTYQLDYGHRAKSTFHPEWTTGGKYKQDDERKYQCCKDDGTPGNIDFVLGRYDEPEYAVEFKHDDSWKHDPLVFDYMKLLDRKNEIQKAISVAVIFRDGELSNQLTLDKVNKTIVDLKERFDSAKRAEPSSLELCRGAKTCLEKERLKLKPGRMASGRPFLFWIIEVAPKATKDKKIRAWYRNDLDARFKPMKDLSEIAFK